MWLRGGNKYKNQKIEVDGIKFDSKAESQMYLNLKMLEKAKKIKDLELQVPFVLIPKFRLRNGKIQRETTYIADFKFFDIEQNRVRIIDNKGFRTKEYQIKKKLFNYIFRSDRGYELEEII